MPITTESLFNSIQSMLKTLDGYEQRISNLEKTSGIYISQSSLQSSVSEIQSSIDGINTNVTAIEAQLQKVTLPSDTRYYLEESEITDFRNHFRQLRSMMGELERSRQAFIRLAARYNMTNSIL